ncbi:MAG: sulfatase-like hydrolase/transferase, partial [Planctomycetaceae bacterium]|nr:sulfatase-like hydrolase/transferase [Planctomycetaceae bacterium]
MNSIPGTLITRGTMTRSGIVICLLSTIALGGEASPATTDRPNVVLIMADDLGFSDLGCYGSEIRTPNLDRLAAEGLRFNQFYNTAKCHSSRICLLTGKYTFQAGNEAMDQALTIAEVMEHGGYFTAMAGKWHLQQEPTDRGFQRYWGHLSGATNYFTGDKSFRLNGQPWQDFDESFYTTDRNVDFAMQFIDEAIQQQKPFFQYIAFNAPHYPLQAREEDIDRYRGQYHQGWDLIRQQRFERQLKSGLLPAGTQLSPRPDYIPAWDQLTADERAWEEARMEVFAAMVDRLDQNIGRLIQHLTDRGVLDNTILLFCSDNGACPFERTKGREFPASDSRSYWCYDVGWAHVGN